MNDRDSIRRWALRSGFDVAARGRLPLAVVDAYEHRDDKPTGMSMTDFAFIRSAVRRREEQIADILMQRAKQAEPAARQPLRRLAKELQEGRL